MFCYYMITVSAATLLKENPIFRATLFIISGMLKRSNFCLQVVLVENKEESIEKALMRIENLNLANISVQLSNLEYFTGPFNIGISLHACGSATDLVLQKCLRAR